MWRSRSSHVADNLKWIQVLESCFTIGSSIDTSHLDEILSPVTTINRFLVTQLHDGVFHVPPLMTHPSGSTSIFRVSVLEMP
jgi:hypothetical protein